MKVLVIGGSGFIGKHVAHNLGTRGHQVLVASRSQALQGVGFVDVTEPEAVRRAIDQSEAECVINLAGVGLTPGDWDGGVLEAINSIGPFTVGEAVALSHQQPRLIHVASALEFVENQEYESRYVETKRQGSRSLSRLIDASTIDATVVYLHNVYGPGQPRGRFIKDLVDVALLGGNLEVRFPDRRRDFCYVEDVAQLIVEVVEKGEGSNSVQIGTGTQISLRDVATDLFKILGGGVGTVSFCVGIGDSQPSSNIASREGIPLLRCSTSLQQGLRHMIGETT